MDDKKASILVLLDMSKVFDSIRHDIMLSKLLKIGVSPPALDWFRSYLCHRSQTVRIEDAVSQRLPLKYGVPQGSILGPVLFTIYVNDLLSVPDRCKSACYVDDTKLYLSFPSSNLADAVHAVNGDLRNLNTWCCQNSLLINPDKTKVLVVGVPQLLRQLPSFSISLFGKKIYRGYFRKFFARSVRHDREPNVFLSGPT